MLNTMAGEYPNNFYILVTVEMLPNIKNINFNLVIRLGQLD